MVKKNAISIKGARLHNLKNISIDIPKNKIVVITGVSGSGKSTLAYDTIYAESQRRYIESLSSYARQFLKNHSKPEVDSIKGLSPSIAIQQKNITRNSRSTVGTETDIYHHLTNLYEKIGKIISPITGNEIKESTFEDFLTYIYTLKNNTKFLICCPIKWEQIKILKQAGYSRILDNQKIYNIESEKRKYIAPNLIIDRLIFDNKSDLRFILQEAYLRAMKIGHGKCYIYNQKLDLLKTFQKDLIEGDIKFKKPKKDFFNFNSPYGACEYCSGKGELIDVDVDKIIPNKNLNILEDAIQPWKNRKMEKWKKDLIKKHELINFPISKKYIDLTEEELEILWKGSGSFKGILGFFDFLKKKSYKIQYRVMLSRYQTLSICKKCKGNRLKKYCENIRISTKSIQQLSNLSMIQLLDFIQKIQKQKENNKIVVKITEEIIVRLKSIINLGLGYLTLIRKSDSLSGGETQKINIAKSISNGLTGIIYILDEPSIGLHPKDTDKLIQIIKNLKKLGNSIIVVEHDKKIIKSADYLIDIGPLAGLNGGNIIYHGIINTQFKKSLTLNYINNEIDISTITRNRNPEKFIKIEGANTHNLKNIDIDIPMNMLCVISGVSGAGKTTLLKEVVFSGIRYKQKDYNFKKPNCKNISLDLSKLKNIVFIDQNIIKKTSKSIPITYIKSFDNIRELFASQTLSKMKNLTSTHFSFNVISGRCENCKGLGVVTIEMQFLSDIELECEVCQGQRYQEIVLEIRFKGKTIFDILNLTIKEGYDFFIEHNEIKIAKKIHPLINVGLGYLKLGQSLSTLSSGEAQRLKLASFLSEEIENSILIFDEPTKGLHFHDIEILIKAFQKLIDNKNTIIAIEHNLDIIKNADWIIELGPESGPDGGEIMFSGKKSEFIKTKNHTAKELIREFNYTKTVDNNS